MCVIEMGSMLWWMPERPEVHCLIFGIKCMHVRSDGSNILVNVVQ